MSSLIQGRAPVIRRRVFDIEGDLALNKKNFSKLDIVKQARQIFTDWLKTKTYVPAEGFDGKDFVTLVHGGQPPAEGIALNNQWAVQLVDDDKDIAGRKWHTEFFLDYRKPIVRCCIRQSVSQRIFDKTDPVFPEILGLPKFVRELCEKVGLFDGDDAFLPEPWEIENNSDLEQFLKLLKNSGRTRPILAIAKDTNSQKPLINVTGLAHKTLGMAHICVLSTEACWQLDKEIGKDFTVFDGAIRTYQPGFNQELDEPYQHPLLVSRRITNWEGGAISLERFLASRLSQACSLALEKANRLYAFSNFRSQQPSPVQTIESILPAVAISAAEPRIVKLQKQVEELSEEKDFYQEEAIKFETENQELNTQLDSLKAEKLSQLDNIRELSEEIKNLKRLNKQPDETFPTTLEDLEKWSNKNWSGKLHFERKAYREAKNSNYENVKLVYEALDLLANEYREMRLKPGTDAKDIYDAKILALSLENQPVSSDDSSISKKDDTYTVLWSGQRRTLDWHLKKGVSRDSRHCLRIYYFWCDETEQVVIGWLPSHLPNKMT